MPLDLEFCGGSQEFFESLMFFFAPRGREVKKMVKEEICYECKIVVRGEAVWGYGSDTLLLFDKHPLILLGGRHGIEKSSKEKELYTKYGTNNPFLCRKCLAELWDTLIWGENESGFYMQNPYR